MAKTKTPFLSLESHGTIASLLTTQKGKSVTHVRTKPIPAYRQTLPQLYQRWLYQDYAYLWTQQTVATRQEYATAGTRHHLTGFQYWIKYNLQNLPDIVGMWHLDDPSGAIAHDFSRQANHGTIIGASPSTGLIDGSFWFDNLNDRIVVPTSSSIAALDNSDWSMGAFFWEDEPAPSGWDGMIIGTAYAAGRSLTQRRFLSQTTPSNFLVMLTYAPAPTSRTWNHIVITHDISAKKLLAYINGTFVGQKIYTEDLAPTSNIVKLGLNDLGVYFFHGKIDHAFVYNRVLDPTEILRHSLRRYPL